MFPPSKLEAEYKPLAEEADLETTEQQPRKEPKFLQRYSQSSRIVHIGIFALEIILCVLLVAGFVALDASRRALETGASLDGLSQLQKYNTTLRFANNSHLLADSNEADEYWGKLLGSGGVVSLDTRWALAQGLEPSAESPTDSTQSIYQVDVFHALHCLNSIRSNLMSATPPPWDEKHMLHCLDYVRHQLLCHPDLTLVTTDDLEEFVLTDKHTCRDYGAVVEWVHRHRWVEFPEWLRSKGSEAKHDH